MKGRRYRQSKLWDHVGRVYTLDAYDNVVNPLVNMRYVKFGRAVAGPRWQVRNDWPLRNAKPLTIPNVISPDTTREMSGQIDRVVRDGLSRQPSGLPNVHIIPDPVSLFGESLLSVFEGPLGDALSKLYDRHFRVEWLDCYRTYPGGESKAWLWHTDNVPPFVAKVIIYLTDVDSQSGPTLVLSPEKTKSLKRARYYPMREENRPKRIEENGLVEIGNEDIAEIHATAGDALILNTNHYHKAVPPSRGYRDAITVLVLPSALSWRESRFRRQPSELIQSGSFPIDPFVGERQALK